MRLTPDWFDLGTSASAFHWLNEKAALIKVARSLRPGGWWAMWWNLFSDGSRTDDFHKVTRPLLRRLDRSPSARKGDRPPFALDAEQRIANLTATNAFENIEVEVISHSAELDTRVVALYSTFSPMSRLKSPERRTLLHKLGQIADNQFAAKIHIRISTPLYTARRFPFENDQAPSYRCRHRKMCHDGLCQSELLQSHVECSSPGQKTLWSWFGWLASGGTHSSHTV